MTSSSEKQTSPMGAPRTDAAIHPNLSSLSKITNELIYYVDAEVSRQLELELASAERRIEEMELKLEAAQDTRGDLDD